MSRTGNRAHEENTRRTRSTGTSNDLCSLPDFRRKSFVFNDSPFQLETVTTVI